MIQDQLLKLYELNQLDLRLQEMRQKVIHAPQRRAEIETTLQEIGHRTVEKKEKVNLLDKEKRDLESELQLSAARFKEFQSKLNQIKTNKEYQAALKEIAETKKANKEMEDRILALMSQIESLTKEAETEAVACRTTQESAEQELQLLGEQEKRVAEESKEHEVKRNEVRSTIDPKLLAQYERLREFRTDAVTAVVHGTCQGCHMKIPPQLFIEIQKFRSIHCCPSCQRILYIPGGSS